MPLLLPSHRLPSPPRRTLTCPVPPPYYFALQHPLNLPKPSSISPAFTSTVPVSTSPPSFVFSHHLSAHHCLPPSHTSSRPSFSLHCRFLTSYFILSPNSDYLLPSLYKKVHISAPEVTVQMILDIEQGYVPQPCNHIQSSHYNEDNVNRT